MCRARRGEPYCSTSSTQPKCMGSTCRTCRVVSSRDVMCKVEFGLYRAGQASFEWTQEDERPPRKQRHLARRLRSRRRRLHSWSTSAFDRTTNNALTNAHASTNGIRRKSSQPLRNPTLLPHAKNGQRRQSALSIKHDVKAVATGSRAATVCALPSVWWKGFRSVNSVQIRPTNKRICKIVWVIWLYWCRSGNFFRCYTYC